MVNDEHLEHELGERRMALRSNDVVVPVCSDGLGPSQVAALVFAGVKRRATASTEVMRPPRRERALGAWCAKPSALPHGVRGGFDPLSSKVHGPHAWRPALAPQSNDALARNFTQTFGKSLAERMASVPAPSFYEDFHALMDPEFSGIGMKRVEMCRARQRDWFTRNVYDVRSQRNNGRALPISSRVLFFCFEGSATLVLHRLCEAARALSDEEVAACQSRRKDWHRNVVVVVVAAAKCQAASLGGRMQARSPEALRLAYISIASFLSPALAASAPVSWGGSDMTPGEAEALRLEEQRRAEAAVARRPLVSDTLAAAVRARGEPTDTSVAFEADEVNRQIEAFVARSVARGLGGLAPEERVEAGTAAMTQATGEAKVQASSEVEDFVAKTLARALGTSSTTVDALVGTETRNRLDDFVKREIVRVQAQQEAKVVPVAPRTFASTMTIATEHAGAVSAIAVLTTREWGSLVARENFAIATAGAGGSDFCVKIWSSETGLQVARLVGHTHWISSLIWLPEKNTIVSGSRDGTLRVWKVPISAHDFGASGTLDFPNTVAEQVIDVGGSDAWGIVRLCHCSCSGRQGSLIAGAFTNDTIRVWDLTHHGMPLGRDMTGHRGEVTALAYVESAAGRQFLISGGTDSTLRFWSIEEACAEGSMQDSLRALRTDAPIIGVSSIECPACNTMNHPTAKKCLLCSCLLRKTGETRSRSNREERERAKRLSLFGGLQNSKGALASDGQDEHAKQIRYTNGLVRCIQFYDPPSTEGRSILPSFGSGDTDWYTRESHQGMQCGFVTSIVAQGNTFWAGFSAGMVKQFHVETGECVATLSQESACAVGPMSVMHYIEAPVLVRCADDGLLRVFDLVAERCFQTIDTNPCAREFAEWLHLAEERGNDSEDGDSARRLKFAKGTVFDRSTARMVLDEDEAKRKHARVSTELRALVSAIRERGRVLRSVTSAFDEIGWALLLADHTSSTPELVPPLTAAQFVGRIRAYNERCHPDLVMGDEALMALFTTIDVDENKRLSSAEVLCGFITLVGLDPETASTKMFDACDASRDGALQFEEFVIAFRSSIAVGSALRPSARSADRMASPGVVGDGMARQMFQDVGKDVNMHSMSQTLFREWFTANMGGKALTRQETIAPAPTTCVLALQTVHTADQSYIVFGTDNHVQLWKRGKSDERVVETMRRSFPAFARANPFKYANMAMSDRSGLY